MIDNVIVAGVNVLGRSATSIAPTTTAPPVVAGATLTRPRPQPIAGTPPPDPNEKYDQKMIQQTCTLFGLDLVSITTFVGLDLVLYKLMDVSMSYSSIGFIAQST